MKDDTPKPVKIDDTHSVRLGVIDFNDPFGLSPVFKIGEKVMTLDEARKTPGFDESKVIIYKP